MFKWIRNLFGNSRALRKRFDEAIGERIAEEEPTDIVDFYFLRLSTIASHLADIMNFYNSEGRTSTIAQWETFKFLELCVEQINARSQHEPDRDWRLAWRQFCACIAKLRRWSGDPQTTAKVAKVIFISSAVIRQLRVTSLPLAPSGLERSFAIYGESVSFPNHGNAQPVDRLEWMKESLSWFLDYNS
jgi:hypothetical protein